MRLNFMQYNYTRLVNDKDEQKLYEALDSFETSAYFRTRDATKARFGFGATVTTDTAELLQDDIAFGGRSFDEQKIKNSTLMNGFWFVPRIAVTMTQTTITFSSDESLDFDTWLAQIPNMKAEMVHVISVDDETDWADRTEKLISTLKSKQTLKKVVFGRQQILKLSNKLYLSRLIRGLSSQNNTYHFILKHQDEFYISATPERLIKVADGHLTTGAVAGTIQRGDNEQDDMALGKLLLASHKNRQEHQYVVENIQQKLQAMTEKLTVPADPILLKTQQVQHLYTPIIGEIDSQYTLVHLMNQLHPTPALGGVPQKEALAYIQDYERTPRGLFASPMGYLDAEQGGELVVGIRAMHVNQRSHQATLFAGAGIVSDSTAAQEFKETALKLKAMRQLLKDYSI